MYKNTNWILVWTTHVAWTQYSTKIALRTPQTSTTTDSKYQYLLSTPILSDCLRSLRVLDSCLLSRLLSLDRLMHLQPMHRHIVRGFDAQMCLVTPNID